MLCLATLTYDMAYKSCIRTVNEKIENICGALVAKYPELDAADIMAVLSADKTVDRHFLERYGIDPHEEPAIAVLESYRWRYMLLLAVIIFGGLAVPVIMSLYIKTHTRRKIADITQDIRRINAGDYSLDIGNDTEDELSALQNEIYKTMVTLREAGENANNDKLILKDALSDISHQLKTPITSLSIALDNLSMCKEDALLREKLIKNARRDVIKISSLVQLILKMSKLEAGTEKMIKQEVSLRTIVSEAVERVEALADLKNIAIEISGRDGMFSCDPFWQAEALVNIIKNAVEHAASDVHIFLESNDVYTAVSVINDGEPMDEEDMRHAFERFYKGKNSSRDSVGVGLALSKTIVEQDGGYISVDTDIGKTRFVIKYL